MEWISRELKYSTLIKCCNRAVGHDIIYRADPLACIGLWKVFCHVAMKRLFIWRVNFSFSVVLWLKRYTSPDKKWNSSSTEAPIRHKKLTKQQRKKEKHNLITKFFLRQPARVYHCHVNMIKKEKKKNTHTHSQNCCHSQRKKCLYLILQFAFSCALRAMSKTTHRHKHTHTHHK